MLCAQWTCHVLRTCLSHIPVSRITCHRLVYSYVSLSVSRVLLLVQIWTVDSSLVTCLFHVSPFVSSTRVLTFLACACLFSSRRFVLMLTHCVCRLVSWLVSWLISLLRTFVIVSHSPLYIRLGMRTRSSSSIYFATTLKVWPARSQVLSLILSRSLAKATASRILRTCPLSTRLPVVKSGLCVYFGTLITICFSKFCDHLMYCNGLINQDVQEWCRLRWLGPRKGQEAETSAHVFSNFFWELVVAG